MEEKHTGIFFDNKWSFIDNEKKVRKIFQF